MNEIINGDSAEELKKIASESVDLVCTDPPYGYSFMGKSWDKTLPDIGIFKECFRVLKSGSFAFVMSAPRSDVCARMMLLLEDAGFEIGFTPIYWTYASGFPKAMNIGKMVDKRNGRDFNPELKTYLTEARERSGKTLKEINISLGYSDKGGNFASDMFSFKKDNRFLYPTLAQWKILKQLLNLDDRFDELIEREEAKREIVGTRIVPAGHAFAGENYETAKGNKDFNDTIAKTDAAKALDGSYGGFQPKPAVEVIIVAMKPLSEKTFVDQALKNGKGVTWLDDCRVPTSEPVQSQVAHRGANFTTELQHDGERPREYSTQGRFPANLLVSDDVLNDGRVFKTGGGIKANKGTAGLYGIASNVQTDFNPDSGSYSRYFDLDAWAKTLPFLIVPKASKSEKNEGLDNRKPQKVNDGRKTPIDNAFQLAETQRLNIHPTVKPLTLMSYLITLGSRPRDVVLDPFVGSGTTCVAAKQLGRQYVGIEREAEYADIARARLNAAPASLF